MPADKNPDVATEPPVKVIVPPPLSVAIPLDDAPDVLMITLVAFIVAVKVASIPCAPLLPAVMVSADNTNADPEPVAKAPFAPVPVEVMELFDKVIVLPQEEENYYIVRLLLSSEGIDLDI